MPASRYAHHGPVMQRSTGGEEDVLVRSIGQLDPGKSKRERPVRIGFEDKAQRGEESLFTEVARVISAEGDPGRVRPLAGEQRERGEDKIVRVHRAEVGIPARLQTHPHFPAAVEVFPEIHGQVDAVEIERTRTERPGSAGKVEAIPAILRRGGEAESGAFIPLTDRGTDSHSYKNRESLH